VSAWPSDPGYRLPEVTPVLLLHGLSGSARWWDRNVAALSREHALHRVDLLALARPFVLAEAADRLVEWMDRRSLDRASVIGHSMGGAVGLDLAARYPARVDRLVLVDAAVRPVPLPRRLRGALVAGWRAPVSLVPLIAADALRAGPIGLWRATRQVLALDLMVQATAVQAPTLLIWGQRDTLVPLEIGRDLVDRLPRARLEIVPGAGHNPMWERPRDFDDLVLSFLRVDAG
jgi:pimeloyl-ACP methyl ester carboxylesterase